MNTPLSPRALGGMPGASCFSVFSCCLASQLSDNLPPQGVVLFAHQGVSHRVRIQPAIPLDTELGYIMRVHGDGGYGRRRGCLPRCSRAASGETLQYDSWLAP